MEKYEDPKFKTVFLKQQVPITDKSRQLVNWFRRFSKNNLSPEYDHGSSGNLSFRYKKGFIIKATKTYFNSIQPQDLVFVRSFDFSKLTAYVEGKGEPSTELQLHKLIYDARKDINAVFHIHDPYIMKLAEAHGIPVTGVTNSGTREIGEDVLRVIDDKHLVVMKDHGVVSVGKTIDEAGQVIIENHKLKI